jgi:hypothetical protein
MTADKRRGRRCVFNQQLWSLLCPTTKACPWLVADDGYSEFHKEAKRLKEAVQFRALFNLGATLWNVDIAIGEGERDGFGWLEKLPRFFQLRKTPRVESQSP